MMFRDGGKMINSLELTQPFSDPTFALLYLIIKIVLVSLTCGMVRKWLFSVVILPTVLVP